jgi:hypothetical protein
MKTLRRFWDWHRNEKPGADLAGAMLQKNLSPTATLAVVEAQRLIAQVMLPRAEDWPALMPALERLSVVICTTYDELDELREARAEAMLGQ